MAALFVAVVSAAQGSDPDRYGYHDHRQEQDGGHDVHWRTLITQTRVICAPIPVAGAWAPPVDWSFYVTENGTVGRYIDSGRTPGGIQGKRHRRLKLATPVQGLP